MDVSYLMPSPCQAVAWQWFLAGLTSGIAGGMILSALMRWVTDARN